MQDENHEPTQPKKQINDNVSRRKPPADSSHVTNRLMVLLLALIIGTFSIFTAAEFRDFAHALFQMSVPVSEKTATGGALFVANRFCCFVIFFAILVMLAIVFAG